MNTLYITRGLPNTGKTTVAKLLTTNVVAADDYPELYANGKYDISKQKAAHEWCKDQVEELLKKGVDVAVHNTFVQLRYCEPYFELAKKYGYKVQIIHCEGLRRYDGEIFDNGHKVPQATIQSMQDRWEPLVKIEKHPPLSEISEQVKASRFLLENLPEIKVIVDRDRTLTVTKSGDLFPKDPYDLKLTKLAYLLRDKLGEGAKIHIATNQRGLSNGNKTLDEMHAEMVYVGELLEEIGLKLGKSAIAPAYTTNEGYLFFSWKKRLRKTEFPSRCDKPGYGMLEYFYKNEPFIFVGDSLDDWRAFKNFQKEFPKATCAYCPVEMFQLI